MGNIFCCCKERREPYQLSNYDEMPNAFNSPGYPKRGDRGATLTFGGEPIGNGLELKPIIKY